MNNSRALAVEVLLKVLRNKAYSNIEINNVLKGSDLSDADSRLMTNIVYGVLQHRYVLEYQIKPYIQDKKVEQWVMILLMTAVYQMQYLDKIPEHAIFNESVEIAKANGNKGVGNFVTAVLRNYQRHGFQELPKGNSTYALSLRHSTPQWLVDLLINQQGLNKAKSVLESINQASDISIRVNTNKISVDELMTKMNNQGFDMKKSPISSVGLTCPHGNLVNTQEFEEGLYTIQDESSMTVAPALDLQPDDQVLDSCAAPGGKTTHIASYLENGSVMALDIHKPKTKLIQENSHRLGYEDIIKTKALDARKAKDAFEPQSFDKILVDAPCSGLGLIRRKPELRYFRKPEDLLDLQKIQLQILDSLTELVKVSGLIVFSTCTFDAEENEDVVIKFLQTHENFEVVPVKHEKGLDKNVHDGVLKLMPDDYFTDGFFVSAFRRKK
ncbi:16S rRNA (cytosine(967)-C(5))-methyltransferase RsmB [Companilactobacillus sp.]|jgi:16S rRNA (cytosine967-C5)-methyltransferase|uniref:16S rRNA (cytosine(967)-C(5))-methyltransferase RsmB n=1 Tax=Companilactobacillus sp. TaxID=2767905 RepID=UPI0025BE3255|nr:16S rRNA (cytosine(967)-C(5))-methyltransferase RsmB [Companilactobacillus sp.]MCH4008037.1 16S rRNA (cytosine(967)-C(5))-methyltransferase RsmB [Companilactobacillus sp.]MCH4051784.1 16S rRNA (cytosine(967)-C(5))-methyltransferase RsmB [Companilactobacillus sp.]MCH4075980.1 16S rRNA (cytosine(967)-C(5))-methyltransferase RsmB [Companilactobacillus sp.]MCH4124555.1 16S rRNA (cytosine(967)-C(5))-methyltransferase RsmB [Companilactobacillus sp.]MCH4132482.1 16S rRNA (cytosine(967)-C(5))-methy